MRVPVFWMLFIHTRAVVLRKCCLNHVNCDELFEAVCLKKSIRQTSTMSVSV